MRRFAAAGSFLLLLMALAAYHLYAVSSLAVADVRQTQAERGNSPAACSYRGMCKQLPKPKEVVRYSRSKPGMKAVRSIPRLDTDLGTPPPSCNCSPWEKYAILTDGCRGHLQRRLDALSTGAFSWRKSAGAFVGDVYSSAYAEMDDELQGVTSTTADACLAPRHVLILGDSIGRELFFSLIQLLTQEPVVDRYIPSGNRSAATAEMIHECDPTGTGMGLNGLDLANCGWPGNRSYTLQSGAKITFQFKTYPETPAMDSFYERQISEILKPDVVIVSTGAWSVPHMKYMRAFNFESYTLNAQVIGFLRRIAPVTPGLVIYMAPRDFSDVYPAVYDWANTGCGDKSTRTVSDGKWQTEQNTGAMEAEVQAKSESGRENEGIVVWNPAAMVACDDSCTEEIASSAVAHGWKGPISLNMARVIVAFLCFH